MQRNRGDFLSDAILTVIVAWSALAVAGSVFILAHAARVFTVAIGQAIQLGVVKAQTDEARRIARGDDWDTTESETPPPRPSLLDRDADELIEAAMEVDRRRARREGRQREFNAEDNATRGNGERAQSFEPSGTNGNGR